MEFHLSCDQVCEISEWLGSVEDVLHDADSLLCASNKLILSCLNLDSLLLAQVLIIMMDWITTSLGSWEAESDAWSVLCLGLGSIEAETSVLNVLAGLLGELDVGVQGGVEGGVEVGDDALVLLETGFADLLGCKSILLEGSSERIGWLEEVSGADGGATESVVESLWGGLWSWLGESGLGFGGAVGLREKLNLVLDGAG